MNKKDFKKFLREHVAEQRSLFLENKGLSEDQKYRKMVSMLRESESIDEGLLDRLGSVIGDRNKNRIKRFLIGRLVSHLGISKKSPLYGPVVRVAVELGVKDLQGILKGNTRIQRKFADTAAAATILTMQQNAIQLFGLSETSFFGGPLSDAIKNVFGSADFQNMVFDSFEKALVEFSDPVHTSDLADEDPDGDGLTNSDEEMLGTDPLKSTGKEDMKDIEDDAPESLKQRAGAPQAGEEEPAELTPEEPVELTAEQKLEQIVEFVKRFTPGGSLGVVKDPSAEGIKKGWIPWVRVFRKHKEGESKGKIKNWEGVNKIYKAFAEAASDNDKIEALYKSKFIKDAGYEAIQADRGGAPEGDLESAKATGDLEKVAGAAAATVADTSVDDEAREDAGETLGDAIDDAPASEEPPPAEEDLIDVEELLAGLGEPAEADEQRFPELEDENRHYDLAKTLPGEEPVFGSVAYTPEGALDWINTALKFDPQADKLEFFVKALKRDPNGNFAYTTGEVVPVEDHPDFKGKLIRPEAGEDPEAEAEAAVQDTEADAADAAADDLERAAANEPEDTALKQQAADAREKANKEREEADEAGAYEEPTWQKNITNAREAALKAAMAADPEGSPKLYRRGVNEFIDRMMDNWEPELRNKAENAKVVKQTKKMTADEYFDQNKNKYATEVWPGEVAKQLRGVAKSIKEKGSTVGMAGIFNFKGADGKVIEVVPRQEELGAPGEAEAPEEPEVKKYNQINVELHDDKTVVLTDRSMRGKIKRSKIGEGMLSEQDWTAKAGRSAGPSSFTREGVTVVELPPIPVQQLAKISGWGTAEPEKKRALTDEIYKLLKQKAESDPEAVEDFDLGSDEETGKPNLVIMSLSTPSGERDKWSGVFDHRTPATPELEPKLKALYDKLVRNYIRKTTDEKENIVAGTFNYRAADRDYGKGIKTIAGRKIKELADAMKIEYTEDDLEYYMADMIRSILIKGGALTPEEEKEEPTSETPPMSPEEEEAMEAGFEEFMARGPEEEEELDEVLKISDDLLRRLLA